MARRFWHDLPLASKIAVFASVLAVFIITALTMLTIQRESDSFRSELEKQANLVLVVTSVRLRDPIHNELKTEMDRVALDMKQNEAISRFRVYDDKGEIKVDMDQLDKYFLDPYPLYSELSSLVPDKTNLYWREEEGELVAETGVWTYEGRDRLGFVQMGFSTRPFNERIRALTVESFALAGVALFIGILLATLIARQLTNPIRELTTTANKMAAGDMSTRFRPEGQDEIGQLGRAFNDLASAVEKRETDLRNLALSLEVTVAERTQELQEQNQYLAALNDVTLGLIENLNVEKLLEEITTRAASLANTEHAFVSIVNPERSELQFRVAQGHYSSHRGRQMVVTQGLSGRVLASGQMMIEQDYQQYEGRHPEFDWLRTAIYVPLRSESEILGVIGLGYDQVVPINPSHVDILSQFAQLASLALLNAQLYSASQQELTATEQALLLEEERRKAYLTSPQGRAESFAEGMLHDPAGALVALHDLAQKAGQNGNAMVLAELPGMLELAGQTLLARLAEGYHFIYSSNSEPELLTVGLRQLRTGLGLPDAGSLLQANEALTIYSLCHQAVEAASIHAITELLPLLRDLQAEADSASIFAGLAGALKALVPIAEALHNYERVDTAEDRRDYLARAVECLSHADRMALELYAAERPIARRIAENWMALVTSSMSDLQTRAQITCRLLSRHSWREEVVPVAMNLRNQGHGMALNLRVRLAPSTDYSLIDELVVVERLAPGEEKQLEFQVRPRLPPGSDQFRAQFKLLYDDPRGSNHVEYFADIVYLMVQESAFQYIANPYVAGTPLEAGSPLFFGREDLFDFIEENLSAAYRNNLVLIGQRRTGKSSLLKQLPIRLSDSYVPVYLDGQSIALDPGLPAFFSNIAVEIGFVLQDRGFAIAIPDIQEFTDRPAHTFEHEYLRRVRAAIGDRHLVLLLDEFEELEPAAKSGKLDASVFGFLRHLSQHESRLSVIFCGTHRMEELAADYWSVLFNISLYKHIGFLEFDEAARLIQEPVAAYGMFYDDLALDKMLRITAGHPYFLQLLCHSLVKQHNRAKRSYITVSDVNTALDEILAYGEAHFVYLWNESSRTERQVLTVLSRIMTLTGHVTPAHVDDSLKEWGIHPGRQVIVDTLHHLALRDILTMQINNHQIGIAGTYSWRLGLLGLWIEKYKSLSLIEEEAVS